jgi:hypothetical protein
MVLMVIGVPPFSMVGRHDGHDCYSCLADISLEVNLLGSPLGLLLLSLVEILGEGGEEGIGQIDHFVMV